ncbi:MAG: hypothetical protein HRU70_01685 [Phycisphaeraceae bacterium]|nr:MAG: hypothetical protein HRU70_01685 [Phycisphaeraceae bacterium]
MSKRSPQRAKKASQTPAAKPSKAKAPKPKATKSKATKSKAAKSMAAKPKAAIATTPRRARRPAPTIPHGSGGATPVQPDTRREAVARPPEADAKAEGFAVTISKTVAASSSTLHAAWADDRARASWLTGCRLSPRDTSFATGVRFAWEGPGDEGSDVAVSIAPKAQGGSMVSVRHARLPDAGGVARARAFWSHRLEALRLAIEGGRLKP